MRKSLFLFTLFLLSIKITAGPVFSSLKNNNIVMIPAPQEVVPTQSQTLQQEIIELQNNEITSSSSNFAQARPIQLPKRFQSPRGIFTNYYDLIIIAALDSVK